VRRFYIRDPFRKLVNILQQAKSVASEQGGGEMETECCFISDGRTLSYIKVGERRSFFLQYMAFVFDTTDAEIATMKREKALRAAEFAH